MIPRITPPSLHLAYAHAHKINRYSYFTFNERLAENEGRFASAIDEDIAVLLKHHERVNSDLETKDNTVIIIIDFMYIYYYNKTIIATSIIEYYTQGGEYSTRPSSS